MIRFATKPAHFSPNGDGYRDASKIGFDLSEPASVSFMVIDAEGTEVRQIVTDRRLAGDAKHRFTWDGRDDEGNVVPDGTYRMRVVRRDESRVIDSVKEISVDTVPPRVELVSAEPSVIATGQPGEPPRCGCAGAGRRTRRRSSASSGPARASRASCGAPRRPERAATWDGSVSAGPSARSPRPRATTPSPSPCATRRAT